MEVSSSGACRSGDFPIAWIGAGNLRSAQDKSDALPARLPPSLGVDNSGLRVSFTLSVKLGKLSRRRFLAAAVLSSPMLAVADAKWLEPDWVRIRRVRMGEGKPAHRFVHFTDVHHKGDRAYLVSIVNKINALSPEFVCFTGDVIEEGKHLAEALELFAGIKSPLYGVPGNHDYWSKVPFEGIAKCFAI